MREGATGVTGSHSPTVRRRELGATLRRLRTEAGLTVEQVAAELLCSTSKVSRLETGQRGASQRDVRDLCTIYGVSDPAERDRLMTLARESKQEAWWHSYDLRYLTYVGFEDEALSIRAYNANVIPGLLQTEDYARSVTKAVLPQRAAGAVAQEVDARMTRQQLLTKPDPPDLQVVLDESVLHRVVGNPGVMRAQLGRLLELSLLPNVTIQVLPYETGALPAVETKFIILEIPSPAVSELVFVEGLVGDLYLEKPADVREYTSVFESLLRMALSPSKTNNFITKLQKGGAS